MDLNSFNQLFSIITVIAGVLAIWYAIFGKAPGFNFEYPKEIKADAEKLLRQFCWIIGPAAIVTGVIDMFPGLEWVYWIGVGIIIPAIIVYVIIYRKRFKHYLNKMK